MAACSTRAGCALRAAHDSTRSIAAQRPTGAWDWLIKHVTIGPPAKKSGILIGVVKPMARRLSPHIDVRVAMDRLRETPRGYYAAVAMGIISATLYVNLVATRAPLPEQWGVDYRFFMDVAHRWRDGQSVYLPLQLAGPYTQTSGRDLIYPPGMLFLFVPLSFLPAALWWLVPMGSLAAVVWRLRPEPWTWVMFALIFAWPRTDAIIIMGNTSMWMAMFLALGLVWGWPAVLVLLKPSLAPLILAGIRRVTWLALGTMAFIAVNLALLPLWADYLTVIRNAGPTWPPLTYSLWDVPLVLLPVVAWLGRTRPEGPTSSKSSGPFRQFSGQPERSQVLPTPGNRDHP
jgi:hypothetical protein